MAPRQKPPVLAAPRPAPAVLSRPGPAAAVGDGQALPGLTRGLMRDMDQLRADLGEALAAWAELASADDPAAQAKIERIRKRWKLPADGAE